MIAFVTFRSGVAPLLDRLHQPVRGLQLLPQLFLHLLVEILPLAQLDGALADADARHPLVGEAHGVVVVIGALHHHVGHDVLRTRVVELQTRLRVEVLDRHDGVLNRGEFEPGHLLDDGNPIIAHVFQVVADQHPHGVRQRRIRGHLEQ